MDNIFVEAITAKIGEYECIITRAAVIPAVITEDFVLVVLVKYREGLTNKTCGDTIYIASEADEVLMGENDTAILFDFIPFERLPIVKRAFLHKFLTL